MATARRRQLSARGLETAGISNLVDRYSEANSEALDHAPAVRAFRATRSNRYDGSFDCSYFRALRKLMALPFEDKNAKRLRLLLAGQDRRFRESAPPVTKPSQ